MTFTATIPLVTIFFVQKNIKEKRVIYKCMEWNLFLLNDITIFSKVTGQMSDCFLKKGIKSYFLQGSRAELTTQQ